MNFNEKVYAIVRLIPEGKVATYGQIAAIAGSFRASRAVGYALHRNPSQSKTPCHRVVFRDGSLAAGYVFGGAGEQRRLLEAEGIAFTDDERVVLREHRCSSDDLEAGFKKIKKARLQ